MTARILIAEDDADQRTMLAELMSMEGLEVFTAPDGRRSLEQFYRLRPDLLLLDVEMPLVDGLEVCRQVKRNPLTRFTPVMFLSGRPAAQTRLDALRAGGDAYLEKPCSVAELLATIQSLLATKAHMDQLECPDTVVLMLANSVEGRDRYTAGHCQRLSDYAGLLSARLGLGDDDVLALRRAGVVHDIGKVIVPDSILLKPAPLTPAEMSVMRQHPVAGEQICSPMRSFKSVLPVIRHHHERGDGSGYPDGLRGQQIPLLARILQVVDVYDALTTPRGYREAITSAEALEVLRGETRQGWWDADIVVEFERLVTQDCTVPHRVTALTAGTPASSAC